MSVLYVDAIKEQVTTSDSTAYTAPTASNFESAHIIYGNCTNVGGSDAELTVNIVQYGETVATTNEYLPPKVIFSGRYDSVTPLIGATLKAGDFISVKSSLASSLNLKLSIKEIYTDT